MKSSCYFRFLVALLIIQVIVGLTIAGACEYLKQLVQNRVFQFEKGDVLNIFFIVKLFGLHVTFYYLSGIPIIFLFNDVYTRHMGFLLKLWIVLALEGAVGSLLLIWCFDDAVNSLIKKFESSLFTGIKLYPQDPVWVLIFDDMQYDFKCCGVYSHKDWIRINHTSSAKHRKSFFWLPYSCASGEIPAKVELTEDNIHLEGCYTVVSRIIERINVSVLSLSLAAIILLIAIIVMMHVAYSYKRVYSKKCRGYEELSKTTENENSDDENGTS